MAATGPQAGEVVRAGKEYRSRTRILLDVLRGVRDEKAAGVTRLLLIANLSHPRLTGYLDELEGKGWVQVSDASERRTWQITPEGEKVLAELARVERMMQDFGLDL